MNILTNEQIVRAGNKDITLSLSHGKWAVYGVNTCGEKIRVSRLRQRGYKLQGQSLTSGKWVELLDTVNQ